MKGNLVGDRIYLAFPIGKVNAENIYEWVFNYFLLNHEYLLSLFGSSDSEYFNGMGLRLFYMFLPTLLLILLALILIQIGGSKYKEFNNVENSQNNYDYKG
jgi:hypothetical protein